MPNLDPVLMTWVFLALAGAWIAVRLARRRSALRQLAEERLPGAGDGIDETRLQRWLARAGRTDRRASGRFRRDQVLALAGGVVVGVLVSRSAVLAELRGYAAEVPGGFGGMVAQLMGAVPWGVFLTIALVPMLLVRRERRMRVQSIERDMPVLLELLATLGEAGMGFDAALDRVLAAQPAERPLVRELRLFQQDLQAGMARWRAFRRLGRRCDVASVSMFTSALIQSEQIGAGLAASLRGQSADHWNRRREQAMAQAQSLPAKLSVPLVVCFLPALFVITLGPILLDFIKLVDSVIGRSA